MRQTQRLLFLCLFLVFLGTIGSSAQEKELITEGDGFQWYKVSQKDLEANYVNRGAQDLDGRELIPLSEGFDYVFFDRGFFSAGRDRVPPKRYFYSLDGEKVIGTDKYDKVHLYESEGRLYFTVEKNGKKGACDVTGKEIVAPKYSDLVYIKRDYPNEGFIYKDYDGKYQKLNIQLDKPKCSAKIQKVWVEQAYTENDENYMKVFCNFSVKGLANEKALVQMRIKDSKGKWHKMKYALESKDGSYYYQDEINPKSYHTVYRNFCQSYSNNLLKLKRGKQYEVIITIHTWTNIGVLAESDPISFIAATRMASSSQSTYTPRTYIPVQTSSYNTKTSSNSNVRKSSTTSASTHQTQSSYNSSSNQKTSTSNQRSTTRKSSSSGVSEKEPEKCSKCNGSGKVNCRHCKGSGRVTCPACKGGGYNKVAKQKCITCNSKGTIKCSFCYGEGTERCINCNGKGKK